MKEEILGHALGTCHVLLKLLKIAQGLVIGRKVVYEI